MQTFNFGPSKCEYITSINVKLFIREQRSKKSATIRKLKAIERWTVGVCKNHINFVVVFLFNIECVHIASLYHSVRIKWFCTSWKLNLSWYPIDVLYIKHSIKSAHMLSFFHRCTHHPYIRHGGNESTMPFCLCVFLCCRFESL